MTVKTVKIQIRQPQAPGKLYRVLRISERGGYYDRLDFKFLHDAENYAQALAHRLNIPLKLIFKI